MNPRSIMRIVSALYATAMMALFTLVILLNKLSIWDQLPEKDKFWTSMATGFGGLLVVSGWLSVLLKSKVAQCIHGILMLVPAGLGTFGGLATLMDRSVMRGRGPDANPVAGVIYGLGLLLLVLGVLFGGCGLGVLAYALLPSRTKTSSA